MLDFIYPRNCIHCGVSMPEPLRYMCWDCLADLSMVEPPFCACCGDPVAGDVQHNFVCFSCSREKPHFDAARSATRYDGAVGEALRALKYESGIWTVPDLVELLYACVQAEYLNVSFDWITAVPLYSVRRRARGYNQSALLASALARRMRIPIKERRIRRIRPTVSQTGLTAPQRAANVSNAFRVGVFSRFQGDRVLLVDDVMTTGATVNACAGALKKGGAASVHVVTVARG
ncbi:MAG: ComF family protein [Kiritimatiellaceae bacterium]|nr:ComF family protein [Kiritimatiellaceae bacterium]